VKLNLQRPLVFFDLETTGTNVSHDRIVEIAAIKVMPDDSQIEYTRRINPGIAIPPQATAVHHISNEDVRDKPVFAEIADEIAIFFDNCDIAGFNSNKFDIPLLIEEFSRAGKKFDISDRRFVDVQTIFHKMEQRTLIAAYKFYCGKNLEEAHSAFADTRATVEVLKAQLDKYDSLKNDIAFLSDFSTQKKTLDMAGRFVLNEQGQPIFNFGKHKGLTVMEVLEKEPGYYDWMMRGDFAQNTKDVLTGLYYKYKTLKKRVQNP